MPGIFEDAAAAAKRAAEEAAERAREMRRNYLRGQIDEWNGKLSEVREQISGLETEKKNLTAYLGEWERQKRKYNGNVILSEVVIENLLEGWYADDIKEELTICMEEMNKIYKRVRELKDNVSAQIEKLQQYEVLIHNKLTSLRNELNSIF